MPLAVCRYMAQEPSFRSVFKYPSGSAGVRNCDIVNYHKPLSIPRPSKVNTMQYEENSVEGHVHVVHSHAYNNNSQCTRGRSGNQRVTHGLPNASLRN